MSFVSPWFLLAAISIGIPIIIHLFYFRKFKKVYFPNVQFLKELKEEKNAIEKLKKRLILATRILALFFLVMAFAQPFINKNKNQTQQGNTAVAIYIDNSYSMSLQNSGDALLNIAKQKAIDIVNAYSPNDKFILLTNDFEGRHQHWMGKDDILAFIDKINNSAYNRTLSEIFQKQHALFEQSNFSNKESYVISDFQKYIVGKVTDTTYKINLLPIKCNTPKNIYIDTCWLSTPLQSINSPIGLVYRIKSSGTLDEKSIRVTIKINGKIKGVSEINLTKQKEKLDTLFFSVGNTGWQEGELNFNDYPITFDDHFYFTFNINQQRNILSLEDGVSKPFIRSIFGKDAFYNYSTSSSNVINTVVLKPVQLLILNELPFISPSLIETIKSYTENGGSIYIIPNKNIDINSYNSLFSTLQIGKIEPLESKDLSVNNINLQENIFSSIFQSIPKNMEMPAIKQYYPISGAITSGQNMLLELNNGRPLVSKYQSDLGMVFVQSVPLGNEFSNLTASPIFPAMVYNFGIFNASLQDLYFTIGQNNYIAIDNKLSNSEGVYKITNGNFEYIPSQRPAGKKVILGLQNQLTQDGIYDIKNSQTTLTKIAFNFDHRESALNFATIDELKTDLKGCKLQIIDDKNSNIKAAIKQIKEGIVLWKVCLIFTLLFLLIEILLLRFFKP